MDVPSDNDAWACELSSVLVIWQQVDLLCACGEFRA